MQIPKCEQALVRRFGISIPQASADLARYNDMAPENTRYDKNRKTYLRVADFQPVVGVPSAVAVLEGLDPTSSDTDATARPPWASGVTAERAVPRTNRALDHSVLQRLLGAVRERQMVRIRYWSFSRAEPSLRWIAPHAFVDDGDRWHVRAYCANRHDFRDFVVSRITDVMDEMNSIVPTSADLAWHSLSTLKLAANPLLDCATRRALEVEHRMCGGEVSIGVRTCFAYYVRARLGLDLDDSCAPQRKQLVLTNAREVERNEADARMGTEAALAELPRSGP